MPVFAGLDLCCLRGDRLVFDGLSFELQSGESLILVGRNGSGKTSLLRMMAGLLRPWRGRLLWNGAAIDDDPDLHRTRLRYVGHQDAVKPALSAAETLVFWARLAGHRGDVDRLVGNGLALFDLAHLADVPGRFLSAGQRRRLGLARLTVGSAPLWLLDEPSSGLDIASIGRLEAVLADHQARGGLIILSTHVALELPTARTLDLDDYALDPAAALATAEDGAAAPALDDDGMPERAAAGAGLAEDATVGEARA